METKFIPFTEAYLLSLSFEEQIEERVDQLLQEGLTFDAIAKKYKTLMVKAEKILKANNISVAKLKSKGKAFGNRFQKLYDQGKTPKQASKQFMSELLSFTKKLAKPVIDKAKAAGEATEESSTAAKIGVAVVFFIILMIVNTAIMIPLAIAFGPMVGLTLVAIIVGPILEEAVKAYFVANNMAYIGTAVTFGIEYLNYVVMMVGSGMALPVAMMIRVIPLMMHFITTWIQKFFYEKGKETGIPSEMEKQQFVGWCGGVAFHMAFNALALIYNDELIAIFN